MWWTVWLVLILLLRGVYGQAQELSWWAASEKQVQEAPCRNPLPHTAKDIEKYYADVPEEVEKYDGSYEIHGFRFRQERSELVAAFAQLLRSGEVEPNLFDVGSGVTIEKAPENLHEKFKFPFGCHKVLCAAQVVFGKEVGPQMIFLMERFRLNTSPYSFKYASVFNSDEMADVIRSLELIPPHILSFRHEGQKFIRFKRGYTRGMYAKGTTYANPSFELYDSWEDQSSMGRQYTLLHEFSHRLSSGLFKSLHETPEWFKISGWKVTEEDDLEEDEERVEESDEETSEEVMVKSETLVSQYASADASEDFAESMVAYRLNPSLLKRKSPEKYQFIKHLVYDGLEFTSSQRCDQGSQLQKYQKQIDADIHPFSFSEQKEIEKACRVDFYGVLISRGPLVGFYQCINYEATFRWLKKARKNWKSLSPETVFDKDLRLSRLSFKKLREKITPRLQEDFTNWLLQVVPHDSQLPLASFSKELYCSRWWNSEFERVFYEKGSRGSWSERFPHGRSAKEGAVRALCRDLVEEGALGKDLLADRISLPSVLRYVKAKTRQQL